MAVIEADDRKHLNLLEICMQPIVKLFQTSSCIKLNDLQFKFWNQFQKYSGRESSVFLWWVNAWWGVGLAGGGGVEQFGKKKKRQKMQSLSLYHIKLSTPECQTDFLMKLSHFSRLLT